MKVFCNTNSLQAYDSKPLGDPLLFPSHIMERFFAGLDFHGQEAVTNIWSIGHLWGWGNSISEQQRIIFLVPLPNVTALAPNISLDNLGISSCNLEELDINCLRWKQTAEAVPITPHFVHIQRNTGLTLCWPI